MHYASRDSRTAASLGTDVTRVELTDLTPPPQWALMERHLLDLLPTAAREYVQRYTRADGSLLWREEWPGMDGSDDAYEAFFNFPLLAAIGGDLELDRLARVEWEAVTKQFTAFGQVYREYDAYYDWMHHGESNLLLYYFGLTDPQEPRMAARSQRFAKMFTGQDPLAPNYDRELRMFRSPINGSRGPRFVNTLEDWVTHLPILAAYHPPYDDIAGVTRDDWTTDASFLKVVAVMNERMMRGDIPLNLTATALAAHAWLLSRDGDMADFVTSYTQAWIERAERNGGLLPDNIGPTGEIGELMGGNWWGGYYGWQWPHGRLNQLESALIAGGSALLTTGDRRWLELARTQFDQLEKVGRTANGRLELPTRYSEAGWDIYTAPPVHSAAYLWFLSQDPDDAARVDRWTDPTKPPGVEDVRKWDDQHTPDWFDYVHGRNDSYPAEILGVNFREVTRRLHAIRTDSADPETIDIHHFQDHNPVTLEGLLQLTMGCPSAIYHGGLLHASLRHFDGATRRVGLPDDVAVLVRRVDAEGVDVDIINTSASAERELVIQGGAFAEHEIVGLTCEGRDEAVGDTHLSVGLAPGSGGSLRLHLARHTRPATYAHPWHDAP
jgi:hypothetical protein